MGRLHFFLGATVEGMFKVPGRNRRNADLVKSLQAHPKDIKAVPSKAIVAKRLAQCLNPALPSGVHQKALEVYSFIFSMIGRDALSNDLPLYLPGLS